MDEHHVLADPSEPSELRQFSLGDWTGVDVAAGLGAGSQEPDRRGELFETLAQNVVVIGRPRVLSDLSRVVSPAAMRRAPMEIIGERHDRRLGLGHDQARIFPLFRLPLQVAHRAGVAVCEPAVELRRVRIALERRDPHGREAELGAQTFDLDALSRRLRSTILLDGVHGFYSPIVSRRQRAKLTTSRAGGTAASSPYAVNMRQRM